jgi:hypothetical protein
MLTFLKAPQPSAPQSTLLLIKSNVTVPDAHNPDLIADTTVDPAGVDFTTGAAGVRKRLVLLVALTLTDSTNGAPAVQPDDPPQTSGALAPRFHSGQVSVDFEDPAFASEWSLH